MQVIAAVLYSLFVIVVLVPALIGAIVMGVFGRGSPRKEQE